MSLYIQGIGWASPMARDSAELMDVFRQQKDHPAVPDNRSQPRLRRAGRLSQFAWRAVQDALADAGKEWTPEEAGRTALIFVSTHGGICHTIRFFEDIAKTGTAAGSPIFFPETVYNAPPSHVAAILGIEGMITSLVGDSSVVGTALCTAEDWLNAGICEQCLLVAADETHALLENAYACLRLAGRSFGVPTFSDAAAAVLISHYPKGSTIHPHPGIVIRQDSHLLPSLRKLFEAAVKDNKPEIVLTSALSSALRIKEHTAISQLWPTTRLLHPKDKLGESFAASSLGNMVLAEALIRRGEISSALISLVGAYGQASAILLTPTPTTLF